MSALSREKAQLRAADIAANTKAARAAVEQAKAEDRPILADQPVDAAVAEAGAAVKAARETLDHLRGRKLVSEAKAADLAVERQRISFAAHTDDPVARKRLSKLHAEISEHASELASIESAIVEAERRVTAAEAEAARQREMQRARETLARLDDLASAATGCDAALRDFLRSFDQLERVSAAIYRVAGTPSHEIVGALARRALCTILLSHKRVFELEQLAPAARTTFSDMAGAWSRMTRHWCHQRLGQPVRKDKAA